MKYIHIFLALLFCAALTVPASAQSPVTVMKQNTKSLQKDTMMVKHAQPAAVKVTYTCPMHPEVISDQPGKCPKCGMTLVKVKTPAGSEAKKDTTAHKHKMKM